MEGAHHIKAKEELAIYGSMLGYRPHIEYTGFMGALTERGIRNYRLDVYLEPRRADQPPLILEADGTKTGQGHNTKTDLAKMDLRDLYFWQTWGVKTLRIPVPDLVGKNKREPSLILSEMLYQSLKYDTIDRPLQLFERLDKSILYPWRTAQKLNAALIIPEGAAQN